MDSGAGGAAAPAATPTTPSIQRRSSADMSPEAREIVAASSRAPDAPKRCFICLMDEEPSDPPSSWVDPCPCTLEAHQDCMLSWVVDCERSNKPLQCPVCKSTIALEGPWDPAIVLHEAVKKRFSHASPFLLLTGVSLGVQFSLQLYGAMAMWTFSGREALMQYLLGPDMIVNGRVPNSLKLHKVGSIAALTNVAPVLLISQLLPGLGNKLFVPTASLYGIYHVMHDDHFLQWPPTPQLAMAVFPYVRSVYYNLWREFVYPYEASLNRQILGLPPQEPRQNDGDRANRRNADRPGEWGLMGFLQNLLDALEPEDEEQDGGFAAGNMAGQVEVEVARDGNDQADGQQRDVVFEVVIGEFPEDEEREAEERLPDLGAGADGGAPQAVNQEGGGNGNGHEVPQAPPAHRPGLGSILHNVSDSIVSALILPGICFAAGEALRLLVLPRSWTSVPDRPTGRRLGLLQQQWGRSLVGGCIWAVLRDAMRLYTRHRMVATMGSRRVKNVDRRRKKDR